MRESRDVIGPMKKQDVKNLQIFREKMVDLISMTAKSDGMLSLFGKIKDKYGSMWMIKTEMNMIRVNIPRESIHCVNSMMSGIQVFRMKRN